MANLEHIITPKCIDGSDDRRFKSIVSDVLSSLPPVVLKGLHDGRTEHIEHKNKYFPYVNALIISLYDKVQNSDESMQARMRKHMNEIAHEWGFSPTDSSKIISCCEKQHQLNADNSDAKEWYSDQNLSVKYELSKLSDDGFTQAWVNESQWGKEKVTQKQVAKLVEKYPKPARKFGSGRQTGTSYTISPADNPFKSSQTSADVVTSETPSQPVEPELKTIENDEYLLLQGSTETINSQAEVTQAGLLNQICHLIQRVDIDGVYGDDELKSIIQPVHQQLSTLADLAEQKPVRTPKYV